MSRREVHISLITIVRNAEAHLSDTLKSVEQQTLSPYEHIIVDGESTDNTAAICEEYAHRVPYTVVIESHPQKGLYDALNHGIQIARGDVIGILHGDDRFDSQHALKTISDAFAADATLEMTYADIVYNKQNGERGRYYSGQPFRPDMLKWGFMFPHPSMYVTRSLYERYGLYPTGYTVAGDYEWLVRVLLAEPHNIKYLPMCMVLMSPGGLSSRRHNRLLVTPREKLRALRHNGHKVCALRLFGRYVIALKTLFLKRHG
ncbi:MAG: glycosyltransferase [Muribaculaceae bacterium]|nr:glycosyltransferase [Muribaculaceae bacterium]